ncbi:replication restart helicase PriA [Syntrophobacter fumaroxidans]|uniref:Replication restart protein PriA n=1 Tax=Syntrophobacter fumaroxidans (strain DSM 10017 / MPOB) TaxID=335543 RepID=A0LI73_SYNFM|nr:primosomal protein N' [Syntrophobacter fumaroxidans]ABK17125.1 primosomal protein N' [Syntrophobacter fumaroxidans MPOB]
MAGPFAEVSIFSALEKTLHYAIPSELNAGARPGARVLVPLGRRSATGLILARADCPPPDMPPEVRLKPILAVLDDAPVLTPDLIALCRWLASYYFYPVGEVLQTALPSGATNAPQVFVRLTPAGEERAETQRDEIGELLHRRGPTALAELEAACGSPRGFRQKLRELENRGLVERCHEWRCGLPGPKTVKVVRLAGEPDPGPIEHNANLKSLVALLRGADAGIPLSVVRREVRNADYWLRKLAAAGTVRVEEREEERTFRLAQALPEAPPPRLTPDQQEVFDAVSPYLASGPFQPFMLFGVTGSGKTEVYMRLVEETLKRGRGALVLVPEIGLSTQLEALFRQRFGERLAVWHSGVPEGARHDQWRDILAGRRTVVLGARSAVFMPVRDPGLIVVDEEHDPSYKQDDHLRYHARDAALVRARLLGIPVVLGSATPSLQTIHQSRLERYRPLLLPRRILDRPLPTLEIVDMRRESSRARILSHRLRTALAETLQAGDQALLFLNRRGFATCFLCGVCGAVLQCSSCSVSLTYHQREKILRCHYCGKEEAVPERCPACGHAGLFPLGFGTERVEEEVRRELPDARIVRIDRDTVSRPEDLVESLDAVRSGRANVLIGTQMVGKGHDFPDITLVGVINADTALQFPDFRAGETTVQLLMQVAGRAGRGEQPGRVILQTYNQFHYTLEAVLALDYERFCDIELQSREQLRYPPFARFLKFLVTSRSEAQTREAARRLAALCRETAERFDASGRPAAVLGPSPAPLLKLKDRYRWHVFVKAWTSRDLQDFTETVLSGARSDPALRRVQLAVDRDPMMSM